MAARKKAEKRSSRAPERKARARKAGSGTGRKAPAPPAGRAPRAPGAKGAKAEPRAVPPKGRAKGGAKARTPEKPAARPKKSPPKPTAASRGPRREKARPAAARTKHEQASGKSSMSATRARGGPEEGAREAALEERGTAAAAAPARPPAGARRPQREPKPARHAPEPAPAEEPPAAVPIEVEPGLGGLETEELWALYRKAVAKGKDKAGVDELRNALIERHYPLVRYIAERLLQTLPKSIELDDLISAGLFGLMDAIRGFDASRGIKFKTYCSTRVRGAILDQLRSQDWVPRLVRLKASRIERSLQRLTAEYGREPTHSELARSLEMDHQDLVREMQESHAKTMFSLSEKWEDDDGSVEKVEVLEDKGAIDPVRELNRRDLMSFITRSLTHKEKFIIEQYYQFGHTMREIGEMLALTESRVCQIHSNVMGRLKGLLSQRHTALLP